MKKIFIELTNPVHGGIGWEFGLCLWSPKKTLNGTDRWATMRTPKIGDLIVHSYNTSSKSHAIQGLSIVSEECYVTDVEPESAAEWAGHEYYYRIELSNYTELEQKEPLQLFLDTYKDEIFMHHNEQKITGTFYNKNLKVAQKYFEEMDPYVFSLLLDFVGVSNLNDFLKVRSFSSEEDLLKLEIEEVIPIKKDFIVSRRIRDTKIIQDLKKTYNNRCQICGKQIRIAKNKFYSEGAHIKPLGIPHNGSDTKDNIIILCPNHHVEFDYGLITINQNNYINHIDYKNELNERKLSYDRTDINLEYLKYHNANIFKRGI